MKLTDIINENLFSSSNKLKNWEKLLVKSIVDYAKTTFNFNAKIIVKKKSKNNLLGDISLSNASVNNNTFTLHYNPNQSLDMQIQTLIHELTHVKQVVRGELLPTDDWKGIKWKGKLFITVAELKKIKSISDYKALPWEAEAYANMKVYDKKYKSSTFFKQLVGKDKTLDYIIQNL